MNQLIDILVWVLLWITTYGLLYFITKTGITYNKRYGRLILFFLFFTFLTSLYFGDILLGVDGKLTLTPILILILVYILTIFVYSISHKYLQPPTRLIEKYPHQYFIKMDYRYIISKSFDILFQQVMIVIMVMWLSQQNHSLSEIILYFVLLFGLVHVFALFPAGKIFGTYYLIASLIGAVIFPMLILKVNYGFVYSFVIHVSFYSISSVFFWLYAEKLLRAS